jgi:hypothetical protein
MNLTRANVARLEREVGIKDLAACPECGAVEADTRPDCEIITIRPGQDVPDYDDRSAILIYEVARLARPGELPLGLTVEETVELENCMRRFDTILDAKCGTCGRGTEPVPSALWRRVGELQDKSLEAMRSAPAAERYGPRPKLADLLVDQPVVVEG